MYLLSFLPQDYIAGLFFHSFLKSPAPLHTWCTHNTVFSVVCPGSFQDIQPPLFQAQELFSLFALANRRIHILQSVFEGTITKQAAELELRRIESESLLSRDLQALTEQKEKKAPEPEIEEAV